jgi:hypothetical protein
LLPFLLWLLFPLAFYCLILGAINRRPYPLALTGMWDVVGLLFALSGFLLMDGPLLIETMYRREVEEIYQLDLQSAAKDAPPVIPVEAQVERVWTYWLQIWVIYFVLLLCGAAFLIWHRRNVLVIYNIEPHAFQDLLCRVMERIKMDWRMDGLRLLVRCGAVSGHNSHLTTTATESPPGDVSLALPPFPDKQSAFDKAAECDIETFAAMCHVTMRWRRDDCQMRSVVEGEMLRQLKNVTTYYNSAGSWFLSVASVLFGVILMGMMIVFLNLFLSRWH